MEKYIKVSDILELIEECKWWFTSPAFRLSFEGKINDIDIEDLAHENEWNQALSRVSDIIDFLPTESYVNKDKLLMFLWWDEILFIQIFWMRVDEYFSDKNSNLENILALWLKSIVNR